MLPIITSFIIVSTLISLSTTSPVFDNKSAKLKDILNSNSGFSILGQVEDDSRGSNYYLINDKKVTWNVALAVCKSQGVQLVVIEDQSKNNDLKGFLESQGHMSVWTAGNDQAVNGQFVWRWPTEPLDRPMGPYFDWRDGVVPNNPQFSCVGMNNVIDNGCTKYITVYAWDEEPCERLKQFVCEL